MFSIYTITSSVSLFNFGILFICLLEREKKKIKFSTSFFGLSRRISTSLAFESRVCRALFVYIVDMAMIEYQVQVGAVCKKKSDTYVMVELFLSLGNSHKKRKHLHF